MKADHNTIMPFGYDRGSCDHTGDSDNSSSFQYTDLTNCRNIDLLGGHSDSECWSLLTAAWEFWQIRFLCKNSRHYCLDSIQCPVALTTQKTKLSWEHKRPCYLDSTQDHIAMTTHNTMLPWQHIGPCCLDNTNDPVVLRSQRPYYLDSTQDPVTLTTNKILLPWQHTRPCYLDNTQDPDITPIPSLCHVVVQMLHPDNQCWQPWLI